MKILIVAIVILSAIKLSVVLGIAAIIYCALILSARADKKMSLCLLQNLKP